MLTGKSWNGEEESVWANEIADNIRAALKGARTSRPLPMGIVRLLTTAARAHVADADLPRYKIIVQVVLGEMKNQGVRVASRCLWDTDTDNYASVSFKNVRRARALWRVRACGGLRCDVGADGHVRRTSCGASRWCSLATQNSVS